MNKIPSIIPNYVYELPKFSWTKCCEKCPSKVGGDPESIDIFTWPFEERIETTFACAWRSNGYCYLNSKKTYYGDDSLT